MSTIDVPAVATGAAAGLAVAVPAALVGQVVLDGDSALVLVFFVVVLAAFALAGAVAGTRRPDAALRHGVVAGLGAYGAVQVLGIVAQAVRGDDLRPLTYVFNLVLAGAMGALGGLVAERRAERTGR